MKSILLLAALIMCGVSFDSRANELVTPDQLSTEAHNMCVNMIQSTEVVPNIIEHGGKNSKHISTDEAAYLAYNKCMSYKYEEYYNTLLNKINGTITF